MPVAAREPEPAATGRPEPTVTGRPEPVTRQETGEVHAQGAPPVQVAAARAQSAVCPQSASRVQPVVPPRTTLPSSGGNAGSAARAEASLAIGQIDVTVVNQPPVPIARRSRAAEDARAGGSAFGLGAALAGRGLAWSRVRP